LGSPPRPDVKASSYGVLGKEYEIIERGALDDYSVEGAEEEEIIPGERNTSSQSSETVNGVNRVSHDLVISNLQKGIDYLETKEIKHHPTPLHRKVPRVQVHPS